MLVQLQGDEKLKVDFLFCARRSGREAEGGGYSNPIAQREGDAGADDAAEAVAHAEVTVAGGDLSALHNPRALNDIPPWAFHM